MAAGSAAGGDLPGAVEFDPLALAVLETQAVAGKARRPGNGEDRGRIEAAAQQDDRLLIMHGQCRKVRVGREFVGLW